MGDQHRSGNTPMRDDREQKRIDPTAARNDERSDAVNHGVDARKGQINAHCSAS
jgi:hypothetical protein